MKELVALHKHWCTADSVKVVVGPPVATGLPDGCPEELVAQAEMHSAFLRIATWYSLLYVVVEGYRELKIEDSQIDELLSNDQMVNGLRRFRNAIFHYQDDPLGPKLMTFLEMAESEVWAGRLHRAFKSYFERALRIKEIIESVNETGER
ncbi:MULTISPECIES: hypothetical protein [unclassified Marinimicrobium]|jgi:hypothetical protein|uniref:hypothetical protein n=1 Tax=unclassified Marinimicrobium TaxID=2632100 RepID=UPI00257BDF0E|nr:MULTISPECIES: hypothetical protein [unclassified Marinimicrobium]|tara:strand:+ start:307 stop:756 length:450 start_codon:yes stop_codon:yes gene_type:complete